VNPNVPSTAAVQALFDAGDAFATLFIASFSVEVLENAQQELASLMARCHAGEPTVSQAQVLEANLFVKFAERQLAQANQRVQDDKQRLATNLLYLNSYHGAGPDWPFSANEE
jgi:hypothetical protein